MKPTQAGNNIMSYAWQGCLETLVMDGVTYTKFSFSNTRHYEYLWIYEGDTLVGKMCDSDVHKAIREGRITKATRGER